MLVICVIVRFITDFSSKYTKYNIKLKIMLYEPFMLNMV